MKSSHALVPLTAYSFEVPTSCTRTARCSLMQRSQRVQTPTMLANQSKAKDATFVCV